MNKTKVVNIYKDKYDVYIGRAGKGQDGYFGNPFKIGPGASRGSTLNRFRSYFFERLKKDSEFKVRIHALKGKVLGCFCKPHDCHGDVIAHYLNNLE
jgi:hypothetical protein